VTSVLQPEGSGGTFAYDGNSNVVTATLLPKPGSVLSPLVTRLSYDPVFNKPTRITDSRGSVSRSDGTDE